MRPCWHEVQDAWDRTHTTVDRASEQGVVGLPTRVLIDLALPSTAEVTFSGLHQLACWLLERRGDASHNGQRKPFTVSPLQPHEAGPPWTRWAVTLLDREDELLRRALQRLGQQPWLADHELVVGDVVRQRETFHEMAGRPAVERVDLVVRSPTVFSRSGRDYPLPDPALISRGLVSRWNAFCPQDLAISDDEARDLGSQIVLLEHAIETVPVDLRGGARTAFVGSLSLGLVAGGGNDGAGPRHTLARLAGLLPYSGLGAHTTHGLGTVEVDGG